MSIKRLPNGAWELSCYWPDGTRHRKQYPTEDLARKVSSVIEASIALGTWRATKLSLCRPEASHTVASFYNDRFAPEWCKPRLRSWYRYGVSFKMMQPLLGNLPLADFPLQKLSEYVKHRLADGVRASSVNRDLAFLKSLFSYAVRIGVIESNPILRYPLLKHQVEERVIPSLEQYRASQEAVTKQDGILGALVAVAGETGMRRSELLNLRWENVDVRNRIVTVTGQTKSRKPRRIPLSQFAIDALGRIVRRIDQDRVFFPLVFPDRHLAKHGIKLHGLRHFRATQWLRNHVPINYVQQWLGHSSISVTAIYLRYVEDEAEASFKEAEALENQRLNLNEASKG